MKCDKRVSVTDNLYPYSLRSIYDRSICQGLACYSISGHCHAFAVSAEAWHAILYLVAPWQYLPRLGMLFYILSRLGSIRRGLACYSISYHALAASAEAWHAILYLIMPWQHPPRLGMLFYILEAQVEQTETCRRAGSERYLVNMLRRF